MQLSFNCQQWVSKVGSCFHHGLHKANLGGSCEKVKKWEEAVEMSSATLEVSEQRIKTKTGRSASICSALQGQ